jgi:peptidoglycan/LPS O-acetylase OafA/YrhL
MTAHIESKNSWFAITGIPPALKPSYLPSLNGIRGVAITLVLLSHLRLSAAGWYHTVFNGDLGVNIFFVLSGFLITTLCLKEKALTGTLSLKKFYLRRILRIFPVAYLYLLVVALLNYWLNLNIPLFQFLGAGFYILNLSYFRSHDLKAPIGHFWSLATEEQFYLIFPSILKSSFKAFFLSIIFIVAGLPLICTLQDFFTPLNTGLFYAFTHILIKFQGIGVGCLFAIIYFKVEAFGRMISRGKLYFNLLSLFLIFCIPFNFFFTLKAVYLNLFVSILIAYIISSNITSQSDIIFKFLNLKPLLFVGILSYSIYIWHPIFTVHQPWAGKFPYSDSKLLNMLALALVAYLSYTFYEKRFLRLKQHF